MEITLRNSILRSNEMIEYLNNSVGYNLFKIEHLEAIDKAEIAERRLRQKFVNGKYLIDEVKDSKLPKHTLNQRIATLANKHFCKSNIHIDEDMVALYKKSKRSKGTEYFRRSKKKASVSRNIANEMTNLYGSRVFTRLEAAAIGRAIQKELDSRSIVSQNENTVNGVSKKATIKYFSKKGKLELNRRIASFANEELFRSDIDDNAITGEIVGVYKIAKEIYTEKTGKCAWRLPSVRKERGFDEKTGEKLSLNKMTKLEY